MELTTRFHEEAMKMEGAETVYGEVTGVRLTSDDAETGVQKVSGVEVVVNKTVGWLQVEFS
jgi:hypothetical protein